MTTSMRAFRRIRVSDESHRVTTFELFFDLVFVFAFTQVTEYMAHEHSALGILEAMVILALLWWSWVSYSWLSNQTHVDEGVMRLGVCVALVAIFVVALVIPEAFDDFEGGLNGPLVFALAYFVVRLMHLALYLVAAGDDAPLRRQVLRTSTAMFTGSALIVTGALLPASWQLWFWVLGIALDILLTWTLSTGGDWRVHSARHWTERHGLVVILALGESIVAIGVGAAELPVSVPLLVGAVLAITLSVGLWWLYFDVTAIAAEHVLAKRQGAARAALATDAYTYLHLPLIAGIVISALGVEEVIAHVGETEPFGAFGASALLGGTSMYLAGHAFFWRRVGGEWNSWRLVGATVILALIPVAAIAPPLAALVITVAVVLTLVVTETRRFAEQRAAVRAPHTVDG